MHILRHLCVLRVCKMLFVFEVSRNVEPVLPLCALRALCAVEAVHAHRHLIKPMQHFRLRVSKARDLHHSLKSRTKCNDYRFLKLRRKIRTSRVVVLKADIWNLVMMFSSKDCPLSVASVSSGYKEKPFAIVAPIPRTAAFNLEIPPANQRGLPDGSLPNSPESDCDAVPGVGFLDHNTQEIIADFFQLITSPSHFCGRHHKVLQTMKRVVDGLLVKHELVYKGMFNKLHLDEKGDDMSVVGSVAKDLFSDGITNWGRIASLLAFGVAVARYENESGRGHCVSLVAHEISSYLLDNQKEWILKNNSWDGFVEFFYVRDPESSTRTALLAFATVAGIGSVLAYLTR